MREAAWRVGIFLPLCRSFQTARDDGQGGDERLVERVGDRPAAAVARIDELQDARGPGSVRNLVRGAGFIIRLGTYRRR